MTTGGTALLPVIDQVVDDDALQRLAGEWDRLLGDSVSSGIFLSWGWISSWRATLGRDHELRVRVARHPDDGRLLGVAPFAVERRGRHLSAHRALVFLGAGPAAPDHLDLIVRRGFEPSVAEALWSETARSADWDLIDLDGTAERALLGDLLLRRRGDRSRVESTTAPILRLPETWEEYERSLGKNLRQNLRRYRRKLDREAPGAITERLVVAPDDVATTIDELGRLHQQIRERRGDRGAFATSALRDFHRTAAARLNDAGRLRLHRLDCDGRMIAGIVCFRFGDTVSFYTTGYDPTWSKYGPGRRIMARAIAGAIDEGAIRFDFLRGDEAYKDHWGTDLRRVLRIRRPVSPRGRVLWGLNTARRAVRGLPPLSGR